MRGRLLKAPFCPKARPIKPFRREVTWDVAGVGVLGLKGTVDRPPLPAMCFCVSVRVCKDVRVRLHVRMSLVAVFVLGWGVGLGVGA